MGPSSDDGDGDWAAPFRLIAPHTASSSTRMGPDAGHGPVLPPLPLVPTWPIGGSPAASGAVDAGRQAGQNGRLPTPLPRNLAEACGALKKLMDVVLVFAQGDSTIKCSLASRDLCGAMLRLLRPAPFALLMEEKYVLIVLRALRSIRTLSSEPAVAEPLVEAGAVPLLVGFLVREAAALCEAAAGESTRGSGHRVAPPTAVHGLQAPEELLGTVMGALFNLCRVNRVRQAAAAQAGIVQPLLLLSRRPEAAGETAMPGAASQDPAGLHLHALARAMLCDLAHAGAAPRAALWRAHAHREFVALLVSDRWRAPALAALAAWISAAAVTEGSGGGSKALTDTPGAGEGGEPYAEELAAALGSRASLDALVAVFETAEDGELDALLPPFVLLVEHCGCVAAGLGGMGADKLRPEGGSGPATPSGRFMTCLLRRMSVTNKASLLNAYLKLLRACFDAQGRAGASREGGRHGHRRVATAHASSSSTSVGAQRDLIAAASFAQAWDLGPYVARLAASHADKVVTSSMAEALARDCLQAVADKGRRGPTMRHH